MSNRLPILSQEAARAHASSLSTRQTAVERAMEAGAALLEARKPCEHGTWKAWLIETGIPIRTARRYMQLSASGLELATVADLGMEEVGRFLAWVKRESLTTHPVDELARAVIGGRKLNDAEAENPGLIRRLIDEMIERGEEPSHAALMKGVG